MVHIRLRLYPITRSIIAEGGTLRLCASVDGYLLDELSIQDEEAYERPRKVVVIFYQALQEAASRIEYQPRWVDAETGQTYPCSLRLHLPLADVVDALLRDNNFAEQYLILGVFVNSTVEDKLAIFHMGPDDDGEYHWDASVAMQLPASIQWLAPDQEPRQTSFEKPPEPKPFQWQAEAIQAHSAALQAQHAATVELGKELRVIRRLIAVIAVGVLLYALAKAI